MEDFHNPDGTMRSAEDITAMWRQWNIPRPEPASGVLLRDRLAGPETFMYARAMGWKISRCTTAAGTNGAATRKPGKPESAARITACNQCYAWR